MEQGRHSNDLASKNLPLGHLTENDETSVEGRHPATFSTNSSDSEGSFSSSLEEEEEERGVGSESVLTSSPEESSDGAVNWIPINSSFCSPAFSHFERRAGRMESEEERGEKNK